MSENKKEISDAECRRLQREVKESLQRSGYYRRPPCVVDTKVNELSQTSDFADNSEFIEKFADSLKILNLTFLCRC